MTDIQNVSVRLAFERWVYEEGRAAGVVEGRRRGFDEGYNAGFAAARPELVDDQRDQERRP